MKKILLKSITALSLVGLIGACSEVSESNFDQLESKIEDSLPEDNEVGQQSFCKGIIATESSSLNVRTSPEIDDNICTTLEKGTPVIISINGYENGFFKIQEAKCGDENNWGYVSDKYVEVEESCLEDGEWAFSE